MHERPAFITRGLRARRDLSPSQQAQACVKKHGAPPGTRPGQEEESPQNPKTPKSAGELQKYK